MYTIISACLAGLALFGLGLPISWLLPAPGHSQWVYRIAIAPILAITVTTAAAWLLHVLGIKMHPMQLILLIALCWWAAWHYRADALGVREALRSAVGPTAIVAAAAAMWGVTLLGYGLYLPNRDFKNHAYLVAQIAFNASPAADLAVRANALVPPASGAFYPLGLHTLLGWALPSQNWNSIGITAAAAVLCVVICLPLSLVALARQWDPSRPALWWLAGFAAVCFPGLTSPFAFGSVVLLAGTALYCASLSTLWMWLRQPTAGTTAALAMAGVGLLFLHVAEAVGLALVALLALPTLHWAGWRKLRPIHWAGVAAGLMVVVAASIAIVIPLSSFSATAWRERAGNLGALRAVAGVFEGQPGGPPWLGLVWTALVGAGFLLALRNRLAVFPLLALAGPWILVIIAATNGPAWLRLAIAPWYGSIGRITLLAGPPIALLGCLALAAAIGPLGTPQSPAQRRTIVAMAASTALLMGITSQAVPSRRQHLAASLAGAGDTATVAADLLALLKPGETVLNFEGDGTANLFAAARVPIISGLKIPSGYLNTGRTVRGVLASLNNLAAPEVAESLAEMHVGYIAIGTTSTYWDPSVGYSIPKLLTQPELSTALVGSDMMILKYKAAT